MIGTPAGEFVCPLDANLSDGVSEDEAIARALSNNSAFQAMLTQLSAAHGDQVQAGLLTNPNLGTFVPIDVKQWEWMLYMPLEAFLLRPQRWRWPRAIINAWLVPSVLSGNVPGQEIEYPMAFVILGGIVTSTVLNLLLLPVAYSLTQPAREASSPASAK